MANTAGDEGFTDFKCPYCDYPASFSFSYVGTAQACPSCSESVVVPRTGSGYGGKLPIRLETGRLILRRLRPEDRNDLKEVTSDEPAFRYVDGYPFDEEELERWFEADTTVRLTQPDGQLTFGLEIPEIPKLIGYVCLSYADEDHRQMGFTMMINRKYWSRRYGTEAVGGVFAFGFNSIDLRRFTVGCDSRNTPACRMLENAGMRREGEFLKDAYVKGEWINTVWYALLKEEYVKKAAHSPV
jgi:RimJ/RimL family protein N-acetyltransferase